MDPTECSLKPNSITLVGSELVRSWFEPDSVMEFGFYKLQVTGMACPAMIYLQADAT